MFVKCIRRQSALILVLLILVGSTGCVLEKPSTNEANILPFVVENEDKTPLDQASDLSDMPADPATIKEASEQNIATSPSPITEQSLRSSNMTSTTEETTTTTNEVAESATSATRTASKKSTTSTDPDDGLLVYITRTGKKYHRKTCPTIKKSIGVKGVTRAEAEKRGLTPCKVCKPDS